MTMKIAVYADMLSRKRWHFHRNKTQDGRRPLSLPNGRTYMFHVNHHLSYIKTIYSIIIINNESISLSSSKSYMRGEIGYVTEVNLVRK